MSTFQTKQCIPAVNVTLIQYISLRDGVSLLSVCTCAVSSTLISCLARNQSRPLQSHVTSSYAWQDWDTDNEMFISNKIFILY